MTNARTQLTLFVNKEKAAVIEKIRKLFNPAQFALIKSHVTLCREDELDNMAAIQKNLIQLRISSITIFFGSPIRFAENTFISD